MDELREYEVDINGLPHTFQLTTDDAERRGAKPVTKAAPAPANKARRAKNKAR